mmetsp:Transcript_43259/g.115722  ORF Transcript_43259/g.115722 Transcript_43259/m.115722 type:complete len:171 (-) Transcript_43259:115-627(-)
MVTSPRSSPSPPPSGKPRDILNKAKATEIHELKGRLAPKEVAAMYGVSEKAIRDIWNGRTWKAAKQIAPTAKPSVYYSFDFNARCNAIQGPFIANDQACCISAQAHDWNARVQSTPSQSPECALSTEGAKDIDRVLGYWDFGYNVLLPSDHPLVSSEPQIVDLHDSLEIW